MEHYEGTFWVLFRWKSYLVLQSIIGAHLLHWNPWFHQVFQLPGWWWFHTVVLEISDPFLLVVFNFTTNQSPKQKLIIHICSPIHYIILTTCEQHYDERILPIYLQLILGHFKKDQILHFLLWSQMRNIWCQLLNNQHINSKRLW